MKLPADTLPDHIELADMVKNQTFETLYDLSKWAYGTFMQYECVVAGGHAQARFEEALIAIFLAGYYTGTAKE